MQVYLQKNQSGESFYRNLFDVLFSCHACLCDSMSIHHPITQSVVVCLAAVSGIVLNNNSENYLIFSIAIFIGHLSNNWLYYMFTAGFAKNNRYHMKPIPSVLLFHPCLQLADLLLSNYLAEIKIEGSAISSFVAVSILQELRLELRVIQTRIYEYYKVALESIADVLPYFPDGHFAGRVNGLQI